MHPRTEMRVVPDTDRYFHADLGDALGTFHFRFPSYGKAARLVELLQGFEQGDGIDRLVELLDVAGYAIGLCWYHRAFDLETGAPPRSVRGEAWREYGDEVVDELQEHGLRLPHIMVLVNLLITELSQRMGEVAEAEDVAGN